MNKCIYVTVGIAAELFCAVAYSMMYLTFLLH